MPRHLLLYGSNSGNTAFAAEDIAEYLNQQKLHVSCLNVAHARPEDMLGCQLLILGASTWPAVVNGRAKDGQLQDQMASFLTQISHLKLAKTKMAVFGLGDSSYTYFCGAAVLLQKFVQQVGAESIVESLYIDGLPQKQRPLLREWSEQIVINLASLSS